MQAFFMIKKWNNSKYWLSIDSHMHRQDNDCLELKVTSELLIGMPQSLRLANGLAFLIRQKLREIIQTIND